MKIKNIYQAFNFGFLLAVIMVLIMSFVEQITTGFLLWILIGYSIYIIGRYLIEKTHTRRTGVKSDYS